MKETLGRLKESNVSREQSNAAGKGKNGRKNIILFLSDKAKFFLDPKYTGWIDHTEL